MPKGIVPNIDYFELLAADILTRLYVACPTAVSWKFEDFDFGRTFEDEGSDRLAEIWAATVRWLAAEQYIRIQREASRHGEIEFEGVVLAEKAFARLSQTSDAGDATTGERLAATIGEMATKDGQRSLRSIVRKVFTF